MIDLLFTFTTENKMDLIKEAFILFMTEEQDIPVNDFVTVESWVEFINKEMNLHEHVHATWYASEEDSSQVLGDFFAEDEHALSISVDKQKKVFFCTLMEPEQAQDEKTGHMALLLFGLMSKWEHEHLPNLAFNKTPTINMFLSQTEIVLTKKEIETIQSILARMAQSEGYDYEEDLIEKSFELELRAKVLGKTYKHSESEEDSVEEWI
tara:strand:- start:949 stop:1575 length:627 start_codon:yes stop_codon:yes gene_type:complete